MYVIHLSFQLEVHARMSLIIAQTIYSSYVPSLQPPPETTTQEAMNEAHKLKKSFETQDTHKPMVIYSNFNQATSPRLSQSADRGGGGGGGYHSVLPRHKVQQGTRYDPHTPPFLTSGKTLSLIDCIIESDCSLCACVVLAGTWTPHTRLTISTP